MSKKPRITQEDLDAFHKAVEGTKPLQQNKVKLRPTAKVAKPPRTTVQEEAFNLSDATYHEPVQSEEYIAHKHDSISNKILRKLRQGQYNVEATLDMHGMTVENARTAVDHFIQNCLRDGIRTVLFIHGKGHHSHMPVLKNKLNQWLRELPVVLAFCSASPKHGNRGAMYVLLKRTREEDNLLE